MMDMLRKGHTRIQEPSVPYVEYARRGPFCNANFNVPIREGLNEAIETIYNMYESIIIINHKLENLYKETDTVRSLLKTFQEYRRIYMISNMEVYPSFVEIAGTFREVNEKIAKYTDMLIKQYDEPKFKLDAEKDQMLIEFHKKLDSLGWKIEHHFSICEKIDTISIKG